MSGRGGRRSLCRAAGLAATITVLIPLGAATTATTATASSASATARTAAQDECSGLQRCVPIKGPWVRVAAPSRRFGQRVEWELACPSDRYVIAGTDARAAARTVSVAIEGLPGSPVGPGVTTKSAVVFVATNAGSAASPTSFRPAIGCVTAAGGGGSPSQVAYTATFPPFGGLDVHREEHQITPFGVSTFAVPCRSGGRLLHAAHAVGFPTPGPPSARALASVSTTERIVGNAVAVTARVKPESLPQEGATLQIRAVCTQGFQ